MKTFFIYLAVFFIAVGFLSAMRKNRSLEFVTIDLLTNTGSNDYRGKYISTSGPITSISPENNYFVLGSGVICNIKGFDFSKVSIGSNVTVKGNAIGKLDLFVMNNCSI